MKQGIELIFANGEALRERLFSEIELVEDVETLILDAQVIFKLKAEEDEVGRIIFRQAPDDPWLNTVYPVSSLEDEGVDEDEEVNGQQDN